MERLRELADTTTKPISAYIFCLGIGMFRDVLDELSDRVRVESIPDPILETYKSIFGF